MKNLITLIIFIFSLNLLASETPQTTSIWGSVPPSMAKPGDNIHFLSVATGGSNLEYRFYFSIDGQPNVILKDWSVINFTNFTLPLNFQSISFYGEVRGVGLSNSIYAIQTYSYLKDFELSTNEINSGAILAINHPSFTIGQSYDVNFSTTTGFSQTINETVVASGQLRVSVPIYDGKVSVFVNGIPTRKRPVLFIHPTNAVNQLPFAIFNFFESPPQSKIIQFNSNQSYDSDGVIVSYLWDFGDGSTSFDSNPLHVYSDLGTFLVSLTVFDNHGASETYNQFVTITQMTVLNANFTFVQDVNNSLQVNFNASFSTVNQGNIIQYQWIFGDGQGASGKNISHTFSQFNSYNVTLIILDDHGNSATINKIVPVQDTNQPPIASFTFNQITQASPFGADFDSSASFDPDGTIVSYKIDFGDGDISSIQTNPFFHHDYIFKATLLVTLTVTDNKGKVGASSKMITIAGDNLPPNANFIWSIPINVNEEMFVDGGQSIDPDGEIALFRWSIDDVVINETVYPDTALINLINGPRNLKLTVVDNEGKEGNASHLIIVEPRSTNLLNLDFVNGELTNWYTTGTVETIGKCHLFENTKNKKSKRLSRSSREYVWQLPDRVNCMDNFYSAVITSSGPENLKGILTQYTEPNGVYNKLKGKMILLTNEDILTPEVYNDHFIIRTRVAGNDQVTFNSIIDYGINDVTWTTSGAIGFSFASNPIPFEVTLGLQSIDFVVEDNGDKLVDSGMAIFDLELVHE